MRLRPNFAWNALKIDLFLIFKAEHALVVQKILQSIIYLSKSVKIAPKGLWLELMTLQSALFLG